MEPPNGFVFAPAAPILDAVTYSKHAHRKTITAMDVVLGPHPGPTPHPLRLRRLSSARGASCQDPTWHICVPSTLSRNQDG